MGDTHDQDVEDVEMTPKAKFEIFHSTAFGFIGNKEDLEFWKNFTPVLIQQGYNDHSYYFSYVAANETAHNPYSSRYPCQGEYEKLVWEIKNSNPEWSVHNIKTYLSKYFELITLDAIKEAASLKLNRAKQAYYNALQEARDVGVDV